MTARDSARWTTLLGRRWRLTPTGHVFKVLGLTVSGRVEVLDGVTRRYLPGTLVLRAHRRGLLEEAA